MARRGAGLRSEVRRAGTDTVDCTRDEFSSYYRRMMSYYNGYHPELEKEWFVSALRDFCANVPRRYWGEYLASLYDHFDRNALKIAE